MLKRVALLLLVLTQTLLKYLKKNKYVKNRRVSISSKWYQRNITVEGTYHCSKESEFVFSTSQSLGELQKFGLSIYLDVQQGAMETNCVGHLQYTLTYANLKVIRKLYNYLKKISNDIYKVNICCSVSIIQYSQFYFLINIFSMIQKLILFSATLNK